MTLPIPKLRDKAWKLLSEIVRREEKECFTCGAKGNYKEAHAGHFRHGKEKETYLMRENVHRQCVKCNLFLSGNATIYTLRMIDKYGRKKVDEIIYASYRIKRHKRSELDELIIKLKEKLK